jgi:hypothetical protein
MQQEHAAAHDASLVGLVPLVRERLGLDSAFPDEAVLASLQMIAHPTSPHERWQAAFQSSLGHWLGLKASNLNAALAVLVGLLPSVPRSGASDPE